MPSRASFCNPAEPENNIGAEGSRDLAAALPLTQLTLLDIARMFCARDFGRNTANARIASHVYADNCVGFEGAHALAGVLPQTQLLLLDLYGVSLSSVGLRDSLLLSDRRMC